MPGCASWAGTLLWAHVHFGCTLLIKTSHKTTHVNHDVTPWWEALQGCIASIWNTGSAGRWWIFLQLIYRRPKESKCFSVKYKRCKESFITRVTGCMDFFFLTDLSPFWKVWHSRPPRPQKAEYSEKNSPSLPKFLLLHKAMLMPPWLSRHVQCMWSRAGEMNSNRWKEKTLRCAWGSRNTKPDSYSASASCSCPQLLTDESELFQRALFSVHSCRRHTGI